MKRALLVVLTAAALPAAAAAAAVAAEERTIAIRDARVMRVDASPIEKGTVVITGGRISAVGENAAIPPGATVIDGAGKTLYPGLIDGLTTLGLTEIGSVSGSNDVSEVGDINPHAKAWVAVHPQSDLLPVARANGITAALAAPNGGLISGQSALIRLAGDTPDALVIKAPVGMHAVYPTGRPPFDFSRIFDEPELKTFEERQKEKRKNQDKELARLADLLEEAKAYAAGASGSSGAAVAPDLPLQALAPVARGELPIIFRADGEDDIRGAVRFAGEHKLKLVDRGRAGGLALRRPAEGQGRVRAGQRGPAARARDGSLRRRLRQPGRPGEGGRALRDRLGRRVPVAQPAVRGGHGPCVRPAGRRGARAITLSPAEIFGVADRMGSITVGKAANLFLATGDIMDHRVEVTDVIVDGIPSRRRPATPASGRNSRIVDGAGGREAGFVSGPAVPRRSGATRSGRPE